MLLELYSNMSVGHAENVVLKQYGDIVSVADAGKDVTKFGRFESLGTSPETVSWLGGDETFATTNAIDSIISNSASDTTVMLIQGHTVIGTGTSAVFTEVQQEATLNGTTRVVLGTPLARVQRVRVVGTAPIVGDVTVYENGGDDFLQVPAGANQSYKASMTTAGDEYLFVTGFFCSVTKKQSAYADFETQVRDVGGPFRPQIRMSLGSVSQNSDQINFDPYLIVKPNSDIRVVAVSSATGTAVDAAFQGYYAKVIG